MNDGSPPRPRYHYPIEHDGQKKVMEVGEATHRSIQRLIREHYNDFGIDDLKISIPLPPKPRPAKSLSCSISKFMDTGFIWAPYIPVMKPIPLDEELVSTKGVMTRYAHKVIRHDFYSTVKIMDDGGYQDMTFSEIRKAVTAEFAKEITGVQPIEPGVWQDLRSAVTNPCAEIEIPILAASAIIADPSHYPHVCPRCSAPAYIGLMSVDCSRKSCS